jgi:D-amino-acid oxidase
MRDVAVIGAGVVGLSTAIRLLESGYRVTVLAREVGIESQSRLATAVWHVYLVRETPDVFRWAAETLADLYKTADLEPSCGLEVIEGVELFRNSDQGNPPWRNIPRSFEFLTDSYMRGINRQLALHSDCHLEHPVRWGYRVEVPAARMDVYLAWLLERVRICGGRIQRETIDNVESVGARFPIVVNCSGAGAKDLVHDRDFVPVKGQYFIFEEYSDRLRHYWGDDDHPAGMSYAIQRQGQLLVGGTAEFGVEDAVFDLKFDDVLGRLLPLESTLQNLRDAARKEIVCVRPWRKSGVRLERDTSSRTFDLIHNYGHGGSGFSLSWGCAADVVGLLRASH